MKTPSRCIFFLRTFSACSTLLSRTRTCTRRVPVQRVVVFAAALAGRYLPERRRMKRLPYQKRRPKSMHRLSTFRRDPRDMPHLAAGTRLALAVEVQRGAGLRRKRGPSGDVMADQV